MKLFFLSVLICCVSMFAKGQDSTALQFSKGITQNIMKQHLTTLASDEFEGRGSSYIGQKKAAAYIHNYFEQLGLQPLNMKNQNGYFQSFSIQTEQTQGKETLKTLIKGKHRVAKSDYYTTEIFDFSIREFSTVWVGDGLDYSKIDVKEKIAIIWLGLPSAEILKSYYLDSSQTAQIQLMEIKAQKAKENGAKGVFFIYPDNESFNTFRSRSIMMKKINPRPQDFNISMADFITIYFRPKVVSNLLHLSNGEFQPTQKKNYDSKTVKMRFVQDALKSTENVIGMIPGKNKNEYVFITAHYDHLGKVENVIYNGADDNGSGTSTLLELAAAFSKAVKAGYQPEKNIVFAAFSGEELGLLGSEYFTNNLPISAKSISSVFNVDMIGRGAFGKQYKKLNLYIIGEKSETERNEMIVNTYFPMINLNYQYNSKNHHERLYYRSDHYNFAKYGIPFIYFTTGLHNDYHKSTDDSHKINYETLELIAQLMFLNVWQAANE